MRVACWDKQQNFEDLDDTKHSLISAYFGGFIQNWNIVDDSDFLVISSFSFSGYILVRSNDIY